MPSHIAKPCLSRNECAQALKMEHTGMTYAYIAKQFGVSRDRLILTLHYAKQYGFVYFAYQGILIDHLETLKSLGAKHQKVNLCARFLDRTQLNISRIRFSRALTILRPFL